MHPSLKPPGFRDPSARSFRGVRTPAQGARFPQCAPSRHAGALLPHALQAALFVAVVALVSLPQARSFSETFGWLPLWLLAIPSTAWLALWAASRFGDAEEARMARAPRRQRIDASLPRTRAAAGARRSGHRAAA